MNALNCKLCPYFESKKEVINTGKVVVGFCKLRGKHITDLTMRKELCKDKASIDVPTGSKTVKVTAPSEPVYVPKPMEKPMPVPETKPAPVKAPVLPPEKLKALDAMKLLDEQQSKKEAEKKGKARSQQSGESDEAFIRRAVWG